jgi:hypothetical protein
MKPKPLAALNHFTTPFSFIATSFLSYSHFLSLQPADTHSGCPSGPLPVT